MSSKFKMRRGKGNLAETAPLSAAPLTSTPSSLDMAWADTPKRSTPDRNPTVPDNPVLAQIGARGYSAEYRGLPVTGWFEVGLVFDPMERNLVQVDWIVVDAA